ncbi:MAG: hypothetical protein IJ347_01215, partial [Faecalibacterium sp.]|nr:hypothetical protein [Faecalibacterium sp.]
MAKKLTQREKALALAAVVKNSGADAAAQLAQQYKQQEEKSLQQAIRAAQPVPELTPVQPAKQQTNWYDGLFGNSAAGASAPAVSTGQDNILNTLFTAQAMQDAATLQAHKDLSAAARMGGEYFTAGAKSGLEGLLQGGMAAGDLLQQQQAERLAQQYQGLAALPVLGDKAKQAAQNQQSFARQATEETNRQILAQKQKTDARQQALEQKYADRTGLANDAVKMAAGGIGNMVPYLAAGTVGNLMGLGGLGMAAMGLQTAGGGMADALADGATTEQARANALLQAAAAMGTEKLMGGIPGLAKAGGLADDAVNALAGKLGGKTAQGAAKWGMNAVGEGVEEVAEEALNELAARLTYGKQGSIEQTVRGEKALPELAAEYGQTFAGGALIGGVLDAAGNAVRGGFNWWDGLFGESVPQAAQNPNLQANAKAEQTSPKSEQTSPKSEQTSPIKAGKATVIKSPYSGKGSTPQYTDAVQREKPSFTAENVQAVTQKIAQAQGSGEGFKKALTNLCNEAYGALFGGRRVSVRGLSIDGAPYDVTLNSNVIRKVISDKNLSAEKIAILGNIQNVVENSEYLGSGNFIAKEGSRKVAERYDYFETSVVIDGVPYTVAFDVEVQPGTNNYRTHRVINDISLNVSNQRADTSPAQAAWFEHSSLSKPTVTQPEPTVNPNSVDASTVNTVLQSAAKTPVDRRPRHFDQAQVDSDVLDWKKTKTEATGEKDVLNSLFEGGPKPAGQPVEERKTGGQSRVLGLETDRAWRTQQLAKELRSEWPSRVSQAEMVELLEGVYGQFRTEASEETRRQIAKQAAENILTHSTRQNRELWEQYPELHGFKVQVAKGSDLMNELQYAYGSYAEAKKDLAAHGVQLQQVPEGTKTHLDTDLMELADLYPEFFNAWDNDPLAMVRQMADAYDAIRPRMENQYGESYDDAVQELTSAIYHGAARVEPPQTGAPQRTAEQEAASADANSWADELFPPVTGAPQMPTAREVIDQRNQARATAQEDFAATAQPPENAARVVNTANEPPSELREVKEIREEGVNMALVDEVTVDEGAYFADKRPYFTDTDRAMEQIAPSNTPAGKYMKRNLLEPFKQAKRAYAKNLTTNVREFGRKMKELGILPGSKQDKELQWFREGVRWVRAEGAAKAEARKYTLADLQADDPENWKNIVEANKLYGQWTDAYFERVNQTQQMIYPMAQADVEENIRKMEEQADGALYQRKALEEQLGFYTDAEVNLTKALMNEVREAEAAKARAESYLNRAKEAGKETARAEKSLQQAETRLQRAQKAVAQHPELEDVVNLFRQMDVLQKREKSTRQMAQNLRTGLENGDALRNKRLPYKDNYVPHLKDSVTGLKQLKNILTASDYQIDPHPVGTSEWTKPKSRWAGFMQRRSGEVPYNEGAVQNMLVQMRNYEYKIA